MILPITCNAVLRKAKLLNLKLIQSLSKSYLNSRRCGDVKLWSSSFLQIETLSIHSSCGSMNSGFVKIFILLYQIDVDAQEVYELIAFMSFSLIFGPWLMAEDWESV